MKKELQNIISGIGLGQLKFGLTREQVKEMLGEPDEVETSDDADDIESETWHYDDIEVSISFDEEEDWRLVAISVSSDVYEFEGLKPIGMSKEELLTMLQEKGVEDIDLEDTLKEGEKTLEHYFSDEKAMSFWVEDDLVVDVQWTIVFSDDDTIAWPS